MAPQEELYFDEAHVAPPPRPPRRELAVNKADSDAITLAMPGWHKSSGVDTVTLTATDSTQGWYANAKSHSGKCFHFDSTQGSVQENACP